MIEEPIRLQKMLNQYVEPTTTDAEEMFRKADRQVIDCPAFGSEGTDHASAKCDFGFSLFNRIEFELSLMSTSGRLDAEIVKKSISYNDQLIQDEFIKDLLDHSQDVLSNFHCFLSENQLSSHVWVSAKRPERGS